MACFTLRDIDFCKIESRPTSVKLLEYLQLKNQQNRPYDSSASSPSSSSSSSEQLEETGSQVVVPSTSGSGNRYGLQVTIPLPLPPATPSFFLFCDVSCCWVLPLFVYVVDHSLATIARPQTNPPYHNAILTSYHNTSYHITSYHIIPHHITSLLSHHLSSFTSQHITAASSQSILCRNHQRR